jgi:hypothetical protein
VLDFIITRNLNGRLEFPYTTSIYFLIRKEIC